MLNAIKLLRELFQAGAFPRNFATLSTEDVNIWMQTGPRRDEPAEHGPQPHLQRSAEVAIPRQDQDRRRAGLADAGRKATTVAPAKVEFWGMVHPEERQAQGPRLELHQGDACEGGDAEGGAQRQRPGARLDL